MDVQFGPNSMDEPNLLYKFQRKIKVFNTNNPLSNRGYSLVASASKYGIVFVASPDGKLAVYYLKQLIDKECEPQYLSVKLQEPPTHIAISCDQELLGVTGGQLLLVYNIVNFQNQNVAPSVTIKFDVNPSTFVSALQWNPCMPDTIAIAFFDGTLLVSQVSSAQVKKVQSKARCLCWSPKGKQLVIGNSDGTLCQYKPDLSPMKTVTAPNLFDGAPVEAIAIYWISTYQFAVIYRNASNNSRPAVTIVNTPKGGQPSCLNYEDICYSIGSDRPWYYYLQGLPQWNMILASSSNSMEMATLGSADGATWSQWCQTDEARPELPLTDKKQENYPVGISIDTCAIHQLPWGENETLPHMPLLHVVSQTGLLTVFNIINLHKGIAQVCTPPELLTLPASAMISGIPDDASSRPSAPTPTSAPVTQIKPQPFAQPSQSLQPAQVTSLAPAVQLGSLSTNAAVTPFAAQQPQITQLPASQSTGFSAVSTSQGAEQKHQVDVKQATVVQPQAISVQAKPSSSMPAPKPQPTTQAQEASAAVKAEQERINKLKIAQELKDMLVREVNEFQMELYKFVLKTRDMHIQVQRDLDSINTNFNLQPLDTEKLKKECSLEELRDAIVQLKLELVRACAVVAEARTHAEAKDFQQWTQADPLTVKRVASVKQLAYYVESQLEQAYKALDYKWTEISNKDAQFHKPGQFMIRPILDDVYQPLVRQQEILSQQQAVLRTLKNSLNECDVAPIFKSTSILRSTPFRNKDPLSKLTKNILNMSIEPQNKPKEHILTAQKLDALRDMLSNHKPVKIKPVNVELRQQLAAMRLSYEKSMKERESTPSNVQHVPVIKTEPTVQNAVKVAPPVQTVKIETKTEPIKQPSITIPTFNPVTNVKPNLPGLAHVARTLFTEDAETAKTHQVQLQQVQPHVFGSRQIQQPALQQTYQAQQTPQNQQAAVIPKPTPGFAPPTSITASVNTRSVLKDLLQNKTQANTEAKKDGNTFMGQKICSPTSFSASTASAVTAAPTAVFTSKPIAEINNMFSKFQPQVFVPEAKPTITKPLGTTVNPRSDETGEPEAIGQASKSAEVKTKDDKPLTNLFGMKASTPLSTNSQNVPDILKPSSQGFAAANIENKCIKRKENAPPVVQPTNQISVTSSNIQSVTTTVTSATVSSTTEKPVDSKTEIKTEAIKSTEKTDSTLVTSSASSIFAAANAATTIVQKSQTVDETGSSQNTSVFGASSSTKTTSNTTPQQSISEATTTASSASSIFGAAVASQSIFGSSPTKTTTQTGSIFGSPTSSTASSVFGSTSTQGSIFGTAVATNESTGIATSTTPSVFSSTASTKPTIFSTPPASPSPAFEPTTSQSVFGSTTSVFASTTTTASSVFGTPTSGSIFGAPSNTPVFGSSAAATTSNVFGTTTVTTQTSVFGTQATTTQSVFGTATTTAPSIFGVATATTQALVFGTPATTQTSVFGSPTPSTQSSVFGSPSTQASIFGTPTPTTQASVFKSPTQPAQASVFGSPSQTSQTSVFGSPGATTAQGGSLFGSAESNMFAAASISTTSAPSQPSGGNIFGGSSTNVFGGKSTFGQPNNTAAAIFKGWGSTGQANNFWGSGSTSSSGTGFGTTGFGQEATTQSSSIFGTGSFSTPSSPGQAFSAPQTNSAFGAVEQKPSVFGSPQQQTAPAFGGSPVFGTKPAFGQSASFGSPTGGFGSFGGFNKSPSAGFGSPATFGGAPTFGGAAFGQTSPGKIFGGASPSFGSPTQSNTTFDSLATQNTLTFGNLAQQSGQQPQPPSAFNTSPSFTGWRG